MDSINNFYQGYSFLENRDEIKLNGKSRMDIAFKIEMVAVDPFVNSREIETDDVVKTQIKLSYGKIFYEPKLCRYKSNHEIVAKGNTFEEAVINLARKVRDNY